MPRNLANKPVALAPADASSWRASRSSRVAPGRRRSRPITCPHEVPTEAWIIATPNPVPAGRGPGKTIVNWHTGDGSPGQVYVSIGGGPERLFSTNPSHQEATINGKDEYEFRLYAGTDHAKRLATAKVSRDRPPGANRRAIAWGRGWTMSEARPARMMISSPRRARVDHCREES